MRKITLLRLAALLLLLLLPAALSGCGRAEEPYSIIFDGEALTVDPMTRQIYYGEDVYTYTVSGDERVTYNIQYPNGGSYRWTQYGNSGDGSWSGEFLEGEYLSADVLVDALLAQPEKRASGNPAVALLATALGLFSAVWPRTAWYLDTGWRFRDAEPSEAALVLHRIGGILLIVVGIVFFFI